RRTSSGSTRTSGRRTDRAPTDDDGGGRAERPVATVARPLGSPSSTWIGGTDACCVPGPEDSARRRRRRVPAPLPDLPGVAVGLAVAHRPAARRGVLRHDRRALCDARGVPPARVPRPARPPRPEERRVAETPRLPV